LLLNIAVLVDAFLVARPWPFICSSNSLDLRYLCQISAGLQALDLYILEVILAFVFRSLSHIL